MLHAWYLTREADGFKPFLKAFLRPTLYQYTTTVQSDQTATLDLTKQLKSILCFNQLTLLEICMSKKKKKEKHINNT